MLNADKTTPVLQNILLGITKSIHSRLSWNTINEAFHSTTALFSLAGKHVWTQLQFRYN